MINCIDESRATASFKSFFLRQERVDPPITSDLLNSCLNANFYSDIKDEEDEDEEDEENNDDERLKKSAKIKLENMFENENENEEEENIDETYSISKLDKNEFFRTNSKKNFWIILFINLSSDTETARNAVKG